MLYRILSEALSTWTQKARAIRLRLPPSHQALQDALLVMHVTGRESLCGAMEYELLCLTSREDLALEDFVALPVEIQLVTDLGLLRTVCGFIAEAHAGQLDDELVSYRLVLRDALSLMGHRINTRVFLRASEADVTQALVSEWRQRSPLMASSFEVDWSLLAERFPAREFIMQHNESDADFLRRLWKRRGISWFIRPGEPPLPHQAGSPRHTLVLFDDAVQLPRNAAGAVSYRQDHAPAEEDGIVRWLGTRRLRAGSVSRHAWDHAQDGPMRSQVNTVAEQGELGDHFARLLDDYFIEAPHIADDREDFHQIATARMQRLAQETAEFQADSTIRALRVGEWIGVKDHPELDRRAAHEREFVITRLEVYAENNFPASLDEHVRLVARHHESSLEDLAPLRRRCLAQGRRYLNRFTCVRRGTPLVAAFDPRVDLPAVRVQNAHVVGPAGEELYCDALGRIKLRFHGTRMQDHQHAGGAGASGSERDSAWVRVASHWAGRQWGAISLPRVGDEVLVDFLGGDPDKPIVVGRVYNGQSLPPAFSRVGSLPGNRFLAGIKSKEIQGQRYNQLRLDDTPQQISAQLASQHGQSELNLGWLTHPRAGGRSDARGEGAELRTDQALALRGGQGVLISAVMRQEASGTQLDRAEMLGLLHVLQDVQQQLATLAQTHHADDTQLQTFSRLRDQLDAWEAGSNTQAKSDGGGKPMVAVTAPAGVAITSDEGVALGAQKEIDLISVGNTQFSAGKKLLARVAESICLFAQRLGIQLVAANGKLQLQTHGGDVEVTSARRIVLTAADEIVLQAPRLRLQAQGAQIDLGGGVITQQSSGDHVIRSGNFHHVSGADSQPPGVELPASTMRTDERFILARRGSGRPHVRQRYRIELDDGSVIEGVTDEQGRTALSQDMAMRIARLRIVKE
ncbi:type VI secretion system tip protein VgrG [Herbaspirillum seropedicae]|uniref:type VI secretion system Vgr family protein n=1 Tax=Herbaspirillum seropedicae TaxID=964 RepID=UPI0006527CFC|nr:type VI secretion system Vgr family protein [Herbaspirillum seropedicae]AKN63773.1 type VI secretion protein [Herbaspirillum seropedicae]NQE30117.1 type VI secretion protein [Herbaspirillum seropedicae]UMU19682.1 type VI secretion system tip protein VgrG [Herbaspirillum seropedicae]